MNSSSSPWSPVFTFERAVINSEKFMAIFRLPAKVLSLSFPIFIPINQPYFPMEELLAMLTSIRPMSEALINHLLSIIEPSSSGKTNSS